MRSQRDNADNSAFLERKIIRFQIDPPLRTENVKIE